MRRCAANVDLPICCMAMTASCNSCKGCCSAEQYCAENPGLDDCPGTKIVDGDGPAIVNPGSGTVNEFAGDDRPKSTSGASQALSSIFVSLVFCVFAC